MFRMLLQRITNTRHQVPILIGMWAVIHVVMYMRLGVRAELFDAAVYIKSASYLTANHRLEDIHYVFYAVPILLIAFFEVISPNGVWGFVIFQCILSGVAALALYRSSSALFNNTLAGFFTGCFYLLWWDNMQWNMVVMTDSIACSMTCFVIYHLVHFKDSVRGYAMLFVLLALSFFTRPTGIIVIVGSIMFLLARHSVFLSKFPIALFVLIAALIIVAYIGASLIFSRWDFTEQYVKGNIVTYMDSTEGTPQYYPALRLQAESLDMPDQTLPPLIKTLDFIVSNPLYFIKAFTLKIFYLLAYVRPYFSVYHNVVAFCWSALIYVLFCIGWRTERSNTGVKVFAMSILVVNCVLIGAATVDWDNRFYLPMMPPLVLIAGGGMRALVSSDRVPPKTPL